MTLATLVVGASASSRVATIAAAIDPSRKTVVLLEGFPQGTNSLEPLRHCSNIKISYIAAGCLCCTGNLVMRVTLNRILRDPPEQLFIGLAATDHLEQIKEFLNQSPYNGLIKLTKDLHS